MACACYKAPGRPGAREYSVALINSNAGLLGTDQPKGRHLGGLAGGRLPEPTVAAWSKALAGRAPSRGGAPRAGGSPEPAWETVGTKVASEEGGRRSRRQSMEGPGLQGEESGSLSSGCTSCGARRHQNSHVTCTPYPRPQGSGILCTHPDDPSGNFLGPDGHPSRLKWRFRQAFMQPGPWVHMGRAWPLQR